MDAEEEVASPSPDIDQKPPPPYLDLPTYKDEEFWFDDGTIILVARDVEFRVYAGILAEVSPVLKDLFAKPDHPARTVSMPGELTIPCRVVQLTDSPEDLRYILRVYMPTLDFRCVHPFVPLGCVVLTRSGPSISSWKHPSFHMMSACIRLGLKYQITALSDQVLQRLKSAYPASVAEWDRVNAWIPTGFEAQHAIGVVNLARLTGELSMLPAAFLSCLYLGSGVVHGFAREDGTRENLTLDDIGICIRGQATTREASLAGLLRILGVTPSPDCKGTCKVALRNALRGLEENVSSAMAVDALLHTYRRLLPGDRKLCSACREILDLQYKTERKAFWRRLPELLGIAVPNW